jgi:hypothetical protein
MHMGRLSHQGFALHPDVIAVAASNSRDEQSHYSNFGDEIAICAPSSGAGGRGIVTTDRRGIKGYTSNDYCFDFGGTSSSTPLAAGLAALILSINGDLTAAQVKEVMMETADKIGDPADYVNGHSQKFGHGRINALKAVRRAAELTNHDGAEENPDGDDEAGDENPEGPEGDSAEDFDILITNVTTPTELPGGWMRRLRTTLTFKLSGSQKERIVNSQPAFQVELFQNNTATQEFRFVSSDPNGRLQPQKFEYTRELDFLRPTPGTYELSSKVFVSLPAKKIEVEKSGPAFEVT